jgi:hypothetical protein
LDLWQAARSLSLWGMASKEVLCFHLSHDISGVMWTVHSHLMKDYKEFYNVDVFKNYFDALLSVEVIFIKVSFTKVYNSLVALLFLFMFWGYELINWAHDISWRWTSVMMIMTFQCHNSTEYLSHLSNSQLIKK